MIHPAHLRLQVIDPVLHYLGLYSEAASLLLLGTVAAESQGGKWLAQLNSGVGRGIFSIEPATHTDVWAHFLDFRPALAQMVGTLVLPGLSRLDQLAGNLYYATAIARVIYVRDPEPLPSADDLAGIGKYYLRVYNTKLGKA